jgi:hypothetical protein
MIMKRVRKRIPVLERLAKEMQVLSAEEQRRFLGGGTGTQYDPYTTNEFDTLRSAGSWFGGYVEGRGYVDSNGLWSYSGGANSSNSNSSSGGGNYGNDGGNKNLTDGVDITNSQHFTFNTQSNQAFEQNLKDILSSNSILKHVLHYFDNGYVHMTFGIANIADPLTGAYTEMKSNESFHMVFNKNLILNGGFSPNFAGDNIGYDWSKVHTPEEALVVTVLHEALHAKHFAIYHEAIAIADEALRKGEIKETNDRDNHAAKYLLQRGFNEEFVNCFFNKKGPNFWMGINSDLENSLHDYMKKYDHGVFDKALGEYRADHTPTDSSSFNGSSGTDSYNSGYYSSSSSSGSGDYSSYGSSGSGSSGSGMDYWDTHGVWSTDAAGNLTWTRTS